MKGIGILSGSEISHKDIYDAVKLGENYFKTKNDPRQMATNEENYNYINKHFPGCLNIIKKREKVIGFTIVYPCNKKLMNDFLNKKINERKLFEKIKKSINYGNFEAIYVCDLFIKPEYRRKGIALESCIISIKKLLKIKNRDINLFFWAYSEDGRKFVPKIGEKLKLRVFELGL